MSEICCCFPLASMRCCQHILPRDCGPLQHKIAGNQETQGNSKTGEVSTAPAKMHFVEIPVNHGTAAGWIRIRADHISHSLLSPPAFLAFLRTRFGFHRIERIESFHYFRLFFSGFVFHRIEKRKPLPSPVDSEQGVRKGD